MISRILSLSDTFTAKEKHPPGPHLRFWTLFTFKTGTLSFTLSQPVIQGKTQILKSHMCKDLCKAFRFKVCPQDQRKVSHGATGHGSLVCYSLLCASMHEIKSRLVWARWKTGHSHQSASLHFSRAFHFSLGHLSQTRIHARTHSAPLRRSRITQNRASLQFN